MTIKKHIEFKIGNYRLLFGPSTIEGQNHWDPIINTFSVWLWNGYFWQLEISDCRNGDLEAAKYSMGFKLAAEGSKRKDEVVA